MKKLLVTLIALTVTSQSFAGQTMTTPAIIYDMGGKLDKSFNQSAYEGAEAFRKKKHLRYREFEITKAGQREEAQEKFAKVGFVNPIVMVGLPQAEALEKTADKYPDKQFVIIDGIVHRSNVRSVVYREEEGSFLVGALAAMKTKTKVIGFIGGMDIPEIRKFSCGYAQGAKYVNSSVKVLKNMVGSGNDAWNNPAKGGQLAKAQIDNKADVVFAAAGNTGIGVYQAAKDAGVYAIGVDSNQNYLHPGTMLTSMVKRIDIAVEKAFTDSINGRFTTGIESLGLAENGVTWALDEDNRDLVTGEMETKMRAITQKIVDGTITVHDYTVDNQCPVE